MHTPDDGPVAIPADPRVTEAVMVCELIHHCAVLMRTMRFDDQQAIADRLNATALAMQEADRELSRVGNPAFFMRGVATVIEQWLE